MEKKTLATLLIGAILLAPCGLENAYGKNNKDYKKDYNRGYNKDYGRGYDKDHNRDHNRHSYPHGGFYNLKEFLEDMDIYEVKKMYKLSDSDVMAIGPYANDLRNISERNNNFTGRHHNPPIMFAIENYFKFKAQEYESGAPQRKNITKAYTATMKLINGSRYDYNIKVFHKALKIIREEYKEGFDSYIIDNYRDR